MTSIAAWVGVDSRGPASLNLVSDSRISWSGGSKKWDQGRKIFATTNNAHPFGYCGDVLFPALALPVIVDHIDRGLITGQGGGWQKNVEQILKSLAVDYPEKRDFTVLHAFRIDEGIHCQFKLAVISHESGKWNSILPSIPQSSVFMHIGGSGKQSVQDFDRQWQKSNSADTSRANFSAFCEAIKSGKDQSSGGPPQIGSLYRAHPAKLVGFITNGECYFAGSRLTSIEDARGIEWRNELFERCDGLTKQRLSGAQRHSVR